MQPRLIASYGDAGITYKYSGVENVALSRTPFLLEIKQKIAGRNPVVSDQAQRNQRNEDTLGCSELLEIQSWLS